MFPVTHLFFLFFFLLLWSIENILWALHMKLFLNLFFSQFSSQIQQYISTVKRKSFCLLVFDDTLLEVIYIHLV